MDRKAILRRELKGFMQKISSGFPNSKIIVFGSRAAEDYLEESDYDILVISKKFESVPFLKRAESLFQIWDLKQDADLFGFTPQEIEKRKNELGIVGTAIRKGITIN